MSKILHRRIRVYFDLEDPVVAVLPGLTLERQVKVFQTDAPFLDIGIPSDYAAATGCFERLGNVPKSP